MLSSIRAARRRTVASAAAMALSGCGGGGGSNPPPAPPGPPPVVLAPLADAPWLRPNVASEIDVLANDTGVGLSIQDVQNQSTALIDVLPNGRLRVTPASGFTGEFSFTYRARDQAGTTSAPVEVRAHVGVQARFLVTYAGSRGMEGQGTNRRVVLTTVAGGTATATTKFYSSYSLVQPRPTCPMNGIFDTGEANEQGTYYLMVRCVGGTHDVSLIDTRSVNAAEAVLSTTWVVRSGPRWSVDGSLVSLVIEGAGGPDLVTIDAAARTNTRRAMSGFHSVYDVRALPQVGRFLVNGRSTNGSTELYVFDASSGQATAIGMTSDFSTRLNLSLSADGRYLLHPTFTQSGGREEVLGYDLAGPPGTRVLFTNSQLPALTLERARLVGNSSLLVWLRTAPPEEVIVVETPVSGGPAVERFRYPYDATFSQELRFRGNGILYAADRPDANVDLFSFDSSTQAPPLRLTPPAGVDLTSSHGGSFHYLGARDLLFADHGGRSLAVIRAAAPEIVEHLGPEHPVNSGLQFQVYSSDREGHVIVHWSAAALTPPLGTAGPALRIFDVNLPDFEVEVPGIAADEYVDSILMLSPPP